jgi:hypothetical protein
VVVGEFHIRNEPAGALRYLESSGYSPGLVLVPDQAKSQKVSLVAVLGEQKH